MAVEDEAGGAGQGPLGGHQNRDPGGRPGRGAPSLQVWNDPDPGRDRVGLGEAGT